MEKINFIEGVSMGLNIVISGGAGYIGSSLISSLGLQHNIVIIDNFCIDTQYKRDNVRQLAKQGVRVIEANTAQTEKYKAAIKKMDILVYMASLNSRNESESKPIYYIEQNAKSLQTFLDSVRNYSPHLQKVILTSSRAVYGEGKYQCGTCANISDLIKDKICQCGRASTPLPNRESDITMPQSVYGLTKRFQEEQIQLFCLQHNVSLDIFRIYNVFGQGQEKFYSHIGVLPMLHEQIVNDHEVTLQGNGEIYRDYIDVRDVTEVLLQSIHQHKTKRFEIFNLGSGHSHSLLDICQMFKKTLEVDFVIHKDPGFNDIYHSQADTAKLLASFSVTFNPVSDFIEKNYSVRTIRQ